MGEEKLGRGNLFFQPSKEVALSFSFRVKTFYGPAL